MCYGLVTPLRKVVCGFTTDSFSHRCYEPIAFKQNNYKNNKKNSHLIFMIKYTVIYLFTYVLLTKTISESTVLLLCIIYDELTSLLMYPVHVYSPASDNFRILKLKKTV